MTANVKPSYTSDEVFAASIAAFRINGSYIKRGEQVEGKIPNSVLALELLGKPDLITEEDRSQVDDVRRHWQGLMFTAMSRNLSSFEKSMLEAASFEQINSSEKQTIGLIAFMPMGYETAKKRKDDQERIRMASGAPLGDIGSKVDAVVQILHTRRYEGYNEPRWLCVGITDNDQAVKFYYKSQLPTNEKVHITAKVKSRHDDGVYSLNYVKLTAKETV